MQGNPLLLLAVALPMLFAPVAYAAGRRRPRRALLWMAGVAAVTFAALTALLFSSLDGQMHTFRLAHFCVMGIALAADGFPLFYAWLAALLFSVAAVFSIRYFKEKHGVPRYAFFTLLTMGAVIGVFLSDQLLTTIVFFEIMSLSSYPWVAHEETPAALRAAQTYLWIAVIGGLCLLIGMLLLPQELLALRYSSGRAAEGVSASRPFLPAALMLIGFGAKAGAFPLHVWLPKAHPVAPAPASALLSGMLLKTGVFGIILLSAKFMRDSMAWHALIFWIGAATMIVGAVLALLSVEMKRILACSSMSQIGFILLGAGLFGLLGEDGGAAMQGLAAHMVNHSLFKLILFLCAGAVALGSQSLNLNDIKGFGRGKPLLHLLFLSGMLGIAGAPLFSGFASKTLLHEALKEYVRLSGGTGPYAAAEWLFVLAGGLTVAYMLKLYLCLFWERGPRPKAQAGPLFSKGAAILLSLCAAAVLLTGLFPSAILGGLGRLSAGFFGTEARPVRVFTAEALAGAAVTWGVGLFVYLLVVRGWLSERTADGRVYIDRKPAWMDLEERVYRPLLKGLTAAVSVCFWLIASLPEFLIAGGRRMLLHVRSWRVPMPGGNRFTSALGGLLNGVVYVLNQTVRRRRPVSVDFTCVLAAGNEELGHSMRRIKRSMSYSLLLFCVGLFLLLLYLLI